MVRVEVFDGSTRSIGYFYPNHFADTSWEVGEKSSKELDVRRLELNTRAFRSFLKVLPKAGIRGVGYAETSCKS